MACYPLQHSFTFLRRHHPYFPILNSEDGAQVVNVGENELQVVMPAGVFEEIDTPAAEAGFRRCIAPTPDQSGGFRISGKIAFGDQSCGDPGAADLIFLPELTEASRADNGHARVAPG
jgi:hypothetical protein